MITTAHHAASTATQRTRTPTSADVDLEMLWREHHDRLFIYLAKRIGMGAAEDVMSEIFLAAVRSKERYSREIGDPLPWLFGIAQRQLSRYRREERSWLRSVAAQRPELSSLDPLDETAQVLSARPYLVNALSRLPRRERHVLLLVVWGDLSYEQIAQTLDLPLGTVKSRIGRARLRMTQLLPDDFEKGFRNEY